MIASKELSAQRMEIAFSFAKSFALVDLIGSLFGGITAGIMAGSLTIAFVTTFLGLVAGALAVAVVLLEATSAANEMLDQESAENIEQSKAQRLALERATGAQIAVNAPGGTMTVKQTAKPTIYRANGAIQHIGEQVNVKVEQPQFLTVGDDDTFWLLERFSKLGLARGQHIGEVFPFSREKVRREIYEAIIAALIEAGQVRNRRQGFAGELTEQDPRALIKVVKAKFPEGVKIALPSTAGQ